MITVYRKTQSAELVSKLKNRAENPPPEIIRTVGDVIAEVCADGDAALRRFSLKFDKTELPESFYMTETEKQRLIAKVPAELKTAIERAAANIYDFHNRQKTQSWVNFADGKVMGQRVIPLERVGMYVPGGTAAYPSTVLMCAIPAMVAGVENIVMVTPPKSEGINPAIVCAADVAGVKDIITVGGAQAVAALAYGTETIKRVDKIVGPGNIFVATAKRLVYGAVDIDMIAGPSEVLVIADEDSKPEYVAADLMSQAEHDPMAASVLITTSEALIEKVQLEVEKQLGKLSRDDIIRRSLTENGAAIVVESIDEAVELSNLIAPEHLELSVRTPFDILGKVRNAGSVFMGEYSPEPLGDYYAGPNHVLPTNGTARFASALSVDSFVKRSSYLYYDRKSLENISDDVIRFAESEGLDAHANSIRVRFGE